ncbi:MAG: linked oxidase domain protein [Solirubrobacterales bacterium]|nr:linked oxidase domain protein [Solirubrobacterales bacterium]
MSLTDALQALVGPAHVLIDPELRAPYETDWTGRFGSPAALVVRPGSTEEVASVLAACRAHGARVVPQGGNTGLVGASVPRAGEVVLSLTRLTGLSPVDPATAQVEAGAGVTLGALQAHAREAGFDAGLDFAARDTATLGGIAATNAGGLVAVRHGTARARIAGLEAVLGDGTILRRLSGLLKDNAGYDLPALLVGSEGTLGVITRVRWRLVARHRARIAALVPLDSIDAAAELLGALRTRVPSLEAVEFFLPEGLKLVCDHLRIDPPVRDAAVYVVTEAASNADPTEELADVLPDDALVADDTASRERLWRLRESHTEAIAAAGIPHKMDVGVPLPRLGEFLQRVPAVIEAVAPGARTILFGHLGDGNVHVNVLDLPSDEDAADEAVLRLVADLGGTISAEHGVGTVKARWLSLVRGQDEIAAMWAIKLALDPEELLNPGVMLPAR